MHTCKGKRSFSEVIRDLIEKKGNWEVLTIAFGTRSEEEVEKLKKEIGDVEDYRRANRYKIIRNLRVHKKI